MKSTKIYGEIAPLKPKESMVIAKTAILV